MVPDISARRSGKTTPKIWTSNTISVRILESGQGRYQKLRSCCLVQSSGFWIGAGGSRCIVKLGGRSTKTPANINNFSGLSWEQVGVDFVYASPFSWTNSDTHKQSSKKSQENAGTVPGQSHQNFVDHRFQKPLDAWNYHFKLFRGLQLQLSAVLWINSHYSYSFLVFLAQCISRK